MNNKFKTVITIDPDKKLVRITHKVDPDRQYNKESLKDYIDYLNIIYEQLEND